MVTAATTQRVVNGNVKSIKRVSITLVDGRGAGVRSCFNRLDSTALSELSGSCERAQPFGITNQNSSTTRTQLPKHPFPLRHVSSPLGRLPKVMSVQCVRRDATPLAFKSSRFIVNRLKRDTERMSTL
eukprot:1193617-Prorocentrum_minimum.AAC.2